MKFNFPKLSSTCEGRLKPDRCGPRSSILVCLTPGQWNHSVATLVTALHDLCQTDVESMHELVQHV